MALCRECYVQKSEEKDAEEKMNSYCDKVFGSLVLILFIERFQNENDISGIVLAQKERSDGSASPPRKKIGLSKSMAVESTGIY